MEIAWWELVAALATLALAAFAAGHALLYKRDVRAAIGWVGLVLLVPLLGGLLYLTLGVNRIRRRAAGLPQDRLRPATGGRRPARAEEVGEPLAALARLGERVNPLPLLSGNRVTPLLDGDEAYPAMLAAIDGAQRSVGLATYIFDRDPVGRRFLAALARAVGRGVEVRVLVDAVGLRYSWPAMDRELRRAGVPVARFLPTRLPWKIPYANLRNHRKLLVVDGRRAFTGGMNLRHGHLLGDRPRHPVQDLHFGVEGPAVAELQELFVHDWQFTTREALGGEGWFPPLPERGPVVARVIADGPDEDFDRLRWTLLGALAVATRSVSVVTPYFLPDQALITALGVAALRGVEVDILLPEQNNLRLVQWAAEAQLWQVLERGCRVHLTPPPFDHSKLLLVDEGWALVGSANWDPRSLRLNFEVGVECYDAALGRRLAGIVAAKRSAAREVSLAELDARPLAVRLRDGLARLLSPYL
ncbi:MAG: phospholipase D-like domain-containing protein [Thermoanaerobaculia bacterium]|nr:phospholipase D-like domain-containing protein [Thermoanaerobaculia bacterium]